MYPASGVDQRGMRHAGDWLGIFIHKNDCAVMVTYLLSAAIFSSSRGGVAKSLRLAYILLSIFLIVMTQSRTGWVATTCLLMFAGAIKIMRRFTGRERVALSLIGLCIIMCLAISVSQYSTAILAVLGKDSTVSGRTDIFKNVFGSIIKHPVLGYGYMAFFNGGGGESSDVSLYSRVVLPTVDNGYLGVWLDLGGIGLGLFALTLIRAIRDAIYCFRNNMASDINWYVSIIVLAVVSNTAERMIMIPNYLAWIMYVMACMGLNTEARGIRSQSKIIMVNDTV
jgi:O-antigen ligase